MTFDSNVAIALLDFGFLNNDSQVSGPDGIEQLFDFTVFDENDVDITSSVNIDLTDHSTQGGLTFQATSNLGPTTRSNALVPDGPADPPTGDPLQDLGSFGENTSGSLQFSATLSLIHI